MYRKTICTGKVTYSRLTTKGGLEFVVEGRSTELVDILKTHRFSCNPEEIKEIVNLGNTISVFEEGIGGLTLSNVALLAPDIPFYGAYCMGSKAS